MANNTKNCKYCQMQIPINASICPYCRKKQKMGIGKTLFCSIMVLGLILGFIGAISENKKELKTVEPITLKESVNISSSVSIQASSEVPTPEPTIDMDSLSEEEYKENCEQLWHDDIFYSEDDLTGKYVRLEVYTEEVKQFSVDELMFNVETSEFIRENNLQSGFIVCGISHGEDWSYIGGDMYLFFSNDCDLKYYSYDQGLELIIYGQIFAYSTHNGRYNYCGIIPKYIEGK